MYACSLFVSECFPKRVLPRNLKLLDIILRKEGEGAMSLEKLAVFSVVHSALQNPAKQKRLNLCVRTRSPSNFVPLIFSDSRLISEFILRAIGIEDDILLTYSYNGFNMRFGYQKMITLRENEYSIEAIVKIIQLILELNITHFMLMAFEGVTGMETLLEETRTMCARGFIIVEDFDFEGLFSLKARKRR